MEGLPTSVVRWIALHFRELQHLRETVLGFWSPLIPICLRPQ